MATEGGKKGPVDGRNDKQVKSRLSKSRKKTKRGNWGRKEKHKLIKKSKKKSLQTLKIL